MPRLTFTELLITVSLLLGAAIGMSKLYQAALVNIADSARVNMTKARY